MPRGPSRAREAPAPAYGGHNCTKRCLGILPNNGCSILVCWDFLTLHVAGTLYECCSKAPRLFLLRNPNSLVSSQALPWIPGPRELCPLLPTTNTHTQQHPRCLPPAPTPVGMAPPRLRRTSALSCGCSQCSSVLGWGQLISSLSGDVAFFFFFFFLSLRHCL